MRKGIEIYFKPEEPVSVDSIPCQSVLDRNFSEQLSEQDKQLIESEWATFIQKYPKSINGMQYSLYDTSNGVNVFIPTDFKTYVTISREHERLSCKAHQMRVVCVGATILSKDNYTIIHKRADDATHVPGVYDSSVAGLATLNGKLDFTRALFEKLGREMKITKDSVESFSLTGIHSSGIADFTGFYTFIINTNLSSKELEKKARASFKDNFVIIPQSQIPKFVLENYTQKGACLDGAMTLAASLSYDSFIKTIKGLRDKGVPIQFGELMEGRFVPN